MGKKYTNILPVPTFSWLGVNYSEIEENNNNIPDNKTIIKCEKEDPVKLDIHENKNCEINSLHGEHFTVIQFAESEKNICIDTDINLAENSALRLIQVFTGSMISEINADISENASLELIQLYIDNNDAKSSISVKLNGRKSHFSADIGYSLNGADDLDINLTAEHYGRKSISEITADGVLNDNSRKTFKGTIDFKNGASGAKGTEQENVLLLNKNVINKTVPVILCSEENVEGSHGATIGRLDEKHIFYMRSRGISEEKIYETMARAKLMRLIRMINDKQTERRICGVLNWCDDDE